MTRINIANPDFEYDENDPDGFRSGMFRFGPLLGATRTGTSVYELPPGQAVCPYHYEHGEEEWVMGLQGRATVRTVDGLEELGPFDVMCFPPGPEGAHQIRNDSVETVRVLMWGEVVYPTVSVYPDSGKLGVWTQDKVDNLIVRRESNVDYFEGESNPPSPG